MPSAEYGFGFALKCRDCNHTVVVIALAWFQINHVFDTESRSIHSLWLYAEYCRIYFLVPDRPRLRYEACYFTRALVARRLAGFLLAWSQSTMLFGTLFTSTAAARRQVQMIPWPVCGLRSAMCRYIFIIRKTLQLCRASAIVHCLVSILLCSIQKRGAFQCAVRRAADFALCRYYILQPAIHDRKSATHQPGASHRS